MALEYSDVSLRVTIPFQEQYGYLHPPSVPYPPVNLFPSLIGAIRFDFCAAPVHRLRDLAHQRLSSSTQRQRIYRVQIREGDSSASRMDFANARSPITTNSDTFPDDNEGTIASTNATGIRASYLGAFHRVFQS